MLKVEPQEGINNTMFDVNIKENGNVQQGKNISYHQEISPDTIEKAANNYRVIIEKQQIQIDKLQATIDKLLNMIEKLSK
jgi:hypothetical protein